MPHLAPGSDVPAGSGAHRPYLMCRTAPARQVQNKELREETLQIPIDLHSGSCSLCVCLRLPAWDRGSVRGIDQAVKPRAS